MNDDLRRDLEAAGRRPIPEPRPEFASALEQRLLAVATSRTPAAGSAAAGGAPAVRRRPRPAFGLAASAAALVLLLGGVLWSGGGAGRPDRFELTESVNVSVALADGTTLLNPDGLVLPAGAVVRVGTSGSARIGDVLLRAGDVATVEDRRLRIDRPPESAVGVPGGTMASAPPSVTPARPETPTPAVTPPGPAVTPGTSGRPATERPITPRPDGTTAPATPRRSDAPASAAPSGKLPTATPRADLATLKLDARASGPSEVGVRWTGTPGARRYVLLASVSRLGPASTPTYPGSAIIGEFTRPPADALMLRLRDGVVEIRLVVVALSGDGAVLARSNVARVRFEKAGS